MRGVTLAALASYLVLLIGVGLWSARRHKGFHDYVTGGGRIPAWMLALSFLSNFVSSNSFVGHSAKSYQVGLTWCLVGGIMVACCALSWFVFAPRFAAFAGRTRVTTLPEFFETRFASPALGAVVAVVVVVTTLFYLLAVLRGTALVVASGLGLPYVGALGVIYVVTLVYAALGGLWADVSTDVVQTFVLVAGAVALPLAVLAAEPAATAPPPIEPVPLALVLSVGIAGGVKLLADPKQIIVFYAFQDPARARRFRWVGPTLLLLVYACLFPLGFLARRIAGEVPALESLVPWLVFERGILGAWLGPLFMVALVAAAMSSLDSALLVVASCVERSLFARGGTPPSVARTRLLVVAAATASLLLSIRPLGGIIELTTFAGALLGAALLPAIGVGLTSREIPARAVLASIAFGCAGAVAGKLLPDLVGIRSPWFQDMFVGLAASTLALLPSLRRAPGSRTSGRSAPSSTGRPSPA